MSDEEKPKKKKASKSKATSDTVKAETKIPVQTGKRKYCQGANAYIDVAQFHTSGPYEGYSIYYTTKRGLV